MNHYHLVGICGTGMSGLAGLLKAKGYPVTGSDAVCYPPISELLAKLPVAVQPFSPDNLASRPDFCVIGTAIKRGNPEFEYILKHQLPYASFPEVLREEFLISRKPLVVTGTHGKTTTTALLSWLLFHAGVDPSFLIGGIAKNFESNVRFGEGEYFVIEGDEFETSLWDPSPKFLHYRPWALAANNLEWDHIDMFSSLAEVKKTFKKLLNLIPQEGLTVLNRDDADVWSLNPSCRSKVMTYSLKDPKADMYAHSVAYSREGTMFALSEQKRPQGEFFVPLWGMHNLSNALAAMCLARFAGLAFDTIREGLKEFQGVKRRQEIIYPADLRGRDADSGGHFLRRSALAPPALSIIEGSKVEGSSPHKSAFSPRDSAFYIVDDFAHHPTAIAKTLEGIKQGFPQNRIIAIFEPKTFSAKLKTFQDEYPKAFQTADAVIILSPQYGKIPPEERLSVDELVKSLRDKEAYFAPSLDSLLEMLRKTHRETDVIITMSSGEMRSVHEHIIRELVANKQVRSLERD